MELKVTPREEVLRASRELYRQQFGGQRPDKRPIYRNVRPVLGLSGSRHLLARGRVWEVPPVPWEMGVRLCEIRQGFERIQEEDPEQKDPRLLDLYERLAAEAVKLFPRLVLPQRAGPRRWLWRLGLRGNPWKGASEEEIGEALDFFWRSRTRSPARHRPTNSRATPNRN